MPSMASISNYALARFTPFWARTVRESQRLCKAIAGAIELSSGEYFLNGDPGSFASPSEAFKAFSQPVT